MTSKPRVLPSAVCMIPAYPGNFHLCSRNGKDILRGTFPAIGRLLELCIEIPRDLRCSAADLLALINANPVTPLVLTIQAAADGRIGAVLAPGARAFLVRYGTAASPTAVIPDRYTARQLGLAFLPVVDLDLDALEDDASPLTLSL